MLVVPNAQVVLRTLLLVLPELRPAGGWWRLQPQYQRLQPHVSEAAAPRIRGCTPTHAGATIEGLLCDAAALDVSRWVDPVVVAWLCEPDLPEEQQRLGALYAKHLPAPAAEAAARAAEKDGEAGLHAHRTACTPHAHRMHTACACTPHAHRMHAA